MNRNFGWILVILGWSLGGLVSAQAVDVTEETAVKSGEGAARGYLNRKRSAQVQSASESASRAESPRSEGGSSGGQRYLALQIGTFFSQETYRWGEPSASNPGQFDGAVTYRVGEWTGSMDLFARVGLSTFSFAEGSATKLSLMPVIAFPDADSDFPLYFGAGAGLGVFFKQLRDESALSLDYTIFAGARVLDVFPGVGFLVEGGIKNHILLLSDGQFNALYLNLGAVFEF